MKNGIIFVVSGILLNILGRFVVGTSTAAGHRSMPITALTTIWMIASLGLVLYGMCRVVIALGAQNDNKN